MRSENIFLSFFNWLWNFGEILLFHCTVSVHSPCMWTNFEGVGFLSKLVDGEEINTYNGILMKDFYFQVEVNTVEFSSIFHIVELLFLHSPTLSFDGTLVGVIIEPCWGWLMPKILFMMYGSIVSSPYFI